MSTTVATTSFIMHSDVGVVVADVRTVHNYDVEDIIHDRAIAQAISVQLLSLGRQASPNDPTAARTMPSAYSQSNEELT